MEEFYLVSIFLFALFLLLGTGGVWVALALFGGVAYLGLEMFTSRPAGDAMLTRIWTGSSSWTLTALPLFIWMGEILFRSRLSQDMFRGLSPPWMQRLPGGLVHVNIVGCTIFAAVSGSSAATLTTVGKMSIPELRKRGYPEYMIIGTLTGAATLGLMIPPSLTLIVYGVAVEQSISKLFMAGILPGIVLAGMFMAYVAGWSFLRRSEVPEIADRMTFLQKLNESRFLIPIILLILVVIGSMYGGFATATEAAAIGVLGAFALAAMQGSLTKQAFIDSLLGGATRTSAMIAFILMGGAIALTLAMGFTGLPRALAEFIEGGLQLSRFSLLIALMLFYIVLGMFLDGISSVVLTMAIVQPMVEGAGGIDLIWFGIFIVVVVEMAQITPPPIGFNLFVMQGGITRHEMGYIAKTAIPLFLIMVLMVFVMIAFPQLATWLPDNMVNSVGR